MAEAVVKLLFVTSQAQIDGVGGGVTHTRAMLRLLQAIDGVSVEQLVLPLPWSSAPRAARQGRALLLGWASGQPAKTLYACRPAALRTLRERLEQGAFTGVVLNGADLLPLRHAAPAGCKVILLSHNVESAIIADQMARSRLPAVAKRLLAADVSRTRQSEAAGTRAADLVIAISALDADWYRGEGPDTPVISIPAAFDTPGWPGPRFPPGHPLQAACVAKMSWWPNREGARWLVDEVLPALPPGRCALSFYGPDTKALHDPSRGVTGHGMVENLDTVWSGAHFTVCPVLGGSGVNVKLLESLFNGVPVLTTPHGCRGLPPFADPALAVVEPDAWAGFLASDSARDLAARTVQAETRALFSAQAAKATLAQGLAAL
jgi:hypothetical protein